MRIGVDLSAIQSTKSGVDWYTHRLMKEIMGLLDTSEELFLFSNRETGFEAEAAGHQQVKVVRGYFRYQEPWRQFVLPVLLRQHEVDVCFFTNFVLSMMAMCPMVLTIHDLSFRLFPRTHSLRNVGWARSLVPISTRRASRIISVSDNTKLDLVRLMNVPEEKIEVVYEGVPEEFRAEAEPDDEQALNHYGIIKPYILFVGTLEPRKNLNVLIRAYSQAVREIPDLHLVLAGRRGWMAQSIFDELEMRDLLGRVHITGYVKEEFLPALYRQAAAFVYPSLYEGFGLPPLEAMSCGTPVIVSRSSSLPEVVGEAGMFANPLDAGDLAAAIVRLVTDRRLAETFRKKGIARAAQFSWRQAAQQTLEILRESARV